MSDASTTHSPGTPAAPSRPEKISTQLSVPQLVGGAAAAVTSAVVGSRLGTSGTILGAALGSVVVGVASTVYTTGLRWTRHGVQVAAQQLGARRGGSSAAPDGDATAGARPRGLGRLVGRGLLAAALIFVVGLGALTVLEQVSGHAVGGGSEPSVVQLTRSGSGGGTSGGSGSSTASATPSDQASAEASSAASGSTTATDGATSQASDQSSSQATDQSTSQATDQATSGSDQATSGATSDTQGGSTSQATSGSDTNAAGGSGAGAGTTGSGNTTSGA